MEHINRDIGILKKQATPQQQQPVIAKTRLMKRTTPVEEMDLSEVQGLITSITSASDSSSEEEKEDKVVALKYRLKAMIKSQEEHLAEELASK